VIALALLLVQSTPAPAAQPSVPAQAPAAVAAAEPQPPVAPWDRSFREGLVEIRRLGESGATDEAVAIAERLAVPNAYARKAEDLVRADGWRARVGRALASVGDQLDLLGPPPAVRAEAQFARGVALMVGADRAQPGEERAVRREQARLAFESARLLAGPGELRLDATYDQGLLALQTGEEERAQIPEISGQQPAPPPAPPPTAAPGAKPEPPPDPLALARAAYLAARERFVGRLQMDWRDSDTQANVELIQRRLRELDEIERKREEEKKKQEEQQKQDEQKQDDKKDPSQDQKKDDSKDQTKPDEPKEKEPGEDPKPDEKQEPKPDEQKPDPKDTEQEKDAKPPGALDPKDYPKMSKEEMVQLLERLQQIEDLQKDLQEKLKRMRKVSVEKDW
jgi:hypothetical protein